MLWGVKKENGLDKNGRDNNCGARAEPYISGRVSLEHEKGAVTK